MPNMRVPSIGFIGLGQMDPASQLVYSKAMGRTGGQRSARKRKRATTFKRPRRVPGKAAKRHTRGKSNGRLVKGSAAAKRRMAKLRRMRK